MQRIVLRACPPRRYPRCPLEPRSKEAGIMHTHPMWRCCHLAVCPLKVGLVLLLLLSTVQATRVSAGDVVYTATVYPNPTQLLLDPQNGQVYVVSVGVFQPDGTLIGEKE